MLEFSKLSAHLAVIDRKVQYAEALLRSTRQQLVYRRAMDLVIQKHSATKANDLGSPNRMRTFLDPKSPNFDSRMVEALEAAVPGEPHDPLKKFMVIQQAYLQRASDGSFVARASEYEKRLADLEESVSQIKFLRTFFAEHIASRANVDIAAFRRIVTPRERQSLGQIIATPPKVIEHLRAFLQPKAAQLQAEGISVEAAMACALMEHTSVSMLQAA